MKRLSSTDPRVQKAVDLYKSGMSVRNVCKEVKMDGEALRRVLIDLGVLRTKSQAQRTGLGIKNFKDDAFDILTPEALYWIGFLYADGSIEEKRPRVNLGLAETDIEHLKKFSEFLGGGVPVKNVTSKKNPAGKLKGVVGSIQRTFRVGFSSEQIYKKLRELGFTNNKSHNAVPHELLKNSRDFWRGVVDGDGWLTISNDKYQYPNIGLCGTKDTMIEFVEFVNRSGIISPTTPNKSKGGEVWKVDFRSAPAFKIVTLLYQNATVYLNRKYDKYLEITSPNKIAS